VLHPIRTPANRSRVWESIKPARSLKVKGEPTRSIRTGRRIARRDQRVTLRASSPFRARILRQPPGLCRRSGQMMQVEEDVGTASAGR